MKKESRDLVASTGHLCYALSVNVPGGTTTSHTVTRLTPYTNYNFAITAYNSGGEGPASDEAFAATDEDSKL